MTVGHDAVTFKGMIVKTVLIAACVVALAGCASRVPANTVELTVVSQPPGAYITEKGTGTGGVSPIVLRYPVAGLPKDKNGCSVVKGFDAKWVSGAVASTNSTLLFCAAGNKFHYVLNRNPDAPGLDRDLQHAQALTQRQDARENTAIEAAAAGFAGAMGAWNASAQQRQPAAPVRCVSKKVFERVETVCE